MRPLFNCLVFSVSASLFFSTKCPYLLLYFQIAEKITGPLYDETLNILMLKPTDRDEPGLMLKSQGLPNVSANMGAVQGIGLKISMKTVCQQALIFTYSRHYTSNSCSQKSTLEKVTHSSSFWEDLLHPRAQLSFPTCCETKCLMLKAVGVLGGQVSPFKVPCSVSTEVNAACFPPGYCLWAAVCCLMKCVFELHLLVLYTLLLRANFHETSLRLLLWC